MKKLLFFVFTSIYSFAQTELVFVYFKDKPNKSIFYTNPLSELSQKSLDRRTAIGIPLNDQDAPIEASYIQKIKDLGFTVTDYSKWLNGVAINATSAQITQLQTLSYVKNVESFAKNTSIILKTPPVNKFEKFNEFQQNLTTFDYGNGLSQIDQINLRPLHVAGFTGNGISIAVIDSGFPTVDTGSAYQRIWQNNKIKGGYNFISKNIDIYNTSLNPHGAYVLGAISGYIENVFVGSAPDADLYLYATEIGPVEIPEEQMYWIEAAEEADRKGVDIITSSLGYSVFDDPKYNYMYADMNGTTTFIARGAQIATEKGIFVTTAAGNSGQETWHYLISPADNSKVFTIGAVDVNGVSSPFSSFGPNSVGSIKPDGSTRGSATATVFNNNVTSASGTSLATPVAAGGVACLLQAIATATSKENIRNVLRQTASLSPNHNDQMGFGILNFWKAYQMLKTQEENPKDSFTIYPNPAKDFVYYKTSEKVLKLEIYDQIGRLIKAYSPKFYRIDLQDLQTGDYYLKIETDKNTYIEKLIKQ